MDSNVATSSRPRADIDMILSVAQLDLIPWFEWATFVSLEGGSHFTTSIEQFYSKSNHNVDTKISNSYFFVSLLSDFSTCDDLWDLKIALLLKISTWLFYWQLSDLLNWRKSKKATKRVKELNAEILMMRIAPTDWSKHWYKRSKWEIYRFRHKFVWTLQ